MLLEALAMFETKQPAIQPASKRRRFGTPVTNEEVENAKRAAVPPKTWQDTQYCVRMFSAWRESRVEETGTVIPPLIELTEEDLAHWMTRFILEIRKKDGSPFLSDSLTHIVSGIMRHLRCNGKPSLDFYKDPAFSEFRRSLDAEMKRLKSSGESCKKKQAEPITEEEEMLWKMKLLGDHNPQALSDTMVYFNGLYFALRSGGEHRQLRGYPCQIQVVEKPGETPYLQYTEDVSKNRPGGLKGRRVQPKVVLHHANIQNPSRCFVRLFKLYQSHCPSNRPAEAFYLKPLNKPT